MGFTAVLGLLIGFGCILYGIINDGSSIATFYDLSSILIVIGGTAGAMLLQFPPQAFRKAVGSVIKVLTYRKKNLEDMKKTIVELAYVSKKEGLLALESRIEKLDEEFFKKGIMLIIDGTNPELTKKSLDLEMDLYLQRDEEEQKFMDAAGKFAPAFGMVGTLIGLIKMLKSLNDVASIGPAMAVAIVTTFYGALLANMLFIPMAGRLKYISTMEGLCREMIAEGILSIQTGETPSIIDEKLSTYVEKGKKKGKE
jgi:chemotaxis protein MotA